MIEGNRLEGEIRPRSVPGSASHPILQEIRPQPHVAESGDIRRLRQVREQHRGVEGGQLPLDLRHRFPAIERSSLIAVPVHSEEHLGLDLAEPVHDAPGAKLGRAAGPDRADAGRGEHRDHGFRDVGQGSHDAVPASHADAPERGSDGGDVAGQAGIRDGPDRAILGAKQDRRMIIPASEGVLGVVQFGARTPLRAEHFARGKDA